MERWSTTTSISTTAGTTAYTTCATTTTTTATATTTVTAAATNGQKYSWCRELELILNMTVNVAGIVGNCYISVSGEHKIVES